MRERSKSSAITAVKYDSFHAKTHISIVKLCCLLFFSYLNFLSLRYYTSATRYLMVFVMACLVLCLGFHPSVLILPMSRSMFLTSRLSSLFRRPLRP